MAGTDSQTPKPKNVNVSDAQIFVPSVGDVAPRPPLAQMGYGNFNKLAPSSYDQRPHFSEPMVHQPQVGLPPYDFPTSLGPYSVNPAAGHGFDSAHVVNDQQQEDPYNYNHYYNTCNFNYNYNYPNQSPPLEHWHQHQQVPYSWNISMQQGFMGRPHQCYGPHLEYMVGPTFQGYPSNSYGSMTPPLHGSMPPLGSIRGPAPQQHIATSHVNNTPQLPSPETKTLKTKILEQIEYYFSDCNLVTDPYLISLMDEHGWVPISKIADFNRVKKMCKDLPFIIDSLQNSDKVEVQGDKIRQRNNWSKWIPTSLTNSKLSIAKDQDELNKRIEVAEQLLKILLKI